MSVAMPYIAVSARAYARIDRPAVRGVITETVEGHHAIWAATIPYIPALAAPDVLAARYGLEATGRVEWMLKRQIEFLYALTQMTNAQATFELRYLSDPLPQGGARVRLVLLGKSFAPTIEGAIHSAQTQWERVRVQFPGEAPYSYPLEPVTQAMAPPGTPAWEDESHQHLFWPIAEDRLRPPLCGIFEILKYEDWPNIPFVGENPRVIDYYAHRFVPPKEYANMARLQRILADQRQTAFVSFVVRPVILGPNEEMMLAMMEEWYRRMKNGEVTNQNPALQEQEAHRIRMYEALQRERGAMGELVYTPLTHERHALLQMSVRVVVSSEETSSLVETVRSELIANLGTERPSFSEVCVPRPGDEWSWALFNLRHMEMERWRVTDYLKQRAPDLIRVRFLAPVTEAIAAFRLPTPTAEGQSLGLPVLSPGISGPPLTLPEPQGPVPGDHT